MITYLIRRVLQALLVIVLVSIVVFALLHLLPGGEARASLGPRATKIAIAQFNRQNGLNDPLIVQFGIWFSRVARGNLGYSVQQNQTVAALIAERLPKSLVLGAFATLIALVLAVPLGTVQAVRRNSLTDYVGTVFGFVFYAMPTFFLGLLLIVGFATSLHWFPPEAPQASTVAGLLSQPRALVLPVLTLALVILALFSRYMRSSVMDNLTQDYVRTARAKGAGERRILVRHVVRNSLIPIATLLGLSLPAIFTGALITESVFNFPGMGLLFWNAAQQQDYPLILGVVLVVGAATVVGSLLADVAYAVLDPRVRYVNR